MVYNSLRPWLSFIVITSAAPKCFVLLFFLLLQLINIEIKNRFAYKNTKQFAHFFIIAFFFIDIFSS